VGPPSSFDVSTPSIPPGVTRSEAPLLHAIKRWRGVVFYEGDPDGVALETLWFDDLGNGRARLRTQSLVDSFESRDAWLKSGMEVGVNEGYAKLEEMLADGTV
jgi:hypothetical protein